jgi:hypothetical protein
VIARLKAAVAAWEAPVGSQREEGSGAKGAEGSAEVGSTANELRLLRAEIQDKDNALEQERRAVERLNDEIKAMDTERAMFERQLERAEQDAEACRARHKVLEEGAGKLQQQLESIKKEKTQEFQQLLRSIDSLEAQLAKRAALAHPTGEPGGGEDEGEHSVVYNPSGSPGKLVRKQGSGEGKAAAGDAEAWHGKYTDGTGRWIPHQLPRLERDGELLRGHGTDHKGPFSIEGSLKGTAIQFVKSYPGKRGALKYEGNVVAGRIEGTYTQHGAGGAQGKFFLEGDFLERTRQPSPEKMTPSQQVTSV